MHVLGIICGGNSSCGFALFHAAVKRIKKSEIFS